jgi:hypothetical protein
MIDHVVLKQPTFSALLNTTLPLNVRSAFFNRYAL